MKRAKLITVDKNWWETERDPIDEVAVIAPKRKLPKKLYSVKQVAEKLSVDVDCIYDYIHSGALYAWTVGSRFRIGEEDIEAFMLECARKKGIAS